MDCPEYLEVAYRFDGEKVEYRTRLPNHDWEIYCTDLNRFLDYLVQLGKKTPYSIVPFPD